MRIILTLLVLLCFCTPVWAEDLYTEDLLMEELCMQNDSYPLYAEGMVLVSNALNVREKPFCDADVVDKLYHGDMVFITGACNGYYKINDDRYVDAGYIYITEKFEGTNVFVKKNMKYLRIHYMGRIDVKAAGQGVNTKSSLWFVGNIPIYDVIDGYAYFPRGKESIFTLPLEAFAELTPVGEECELLSAYRTTYSASGNNASRAHNITLSTIDITGTVIEPGKVFSFNKTTGPRSRSKGYQLANAYLGEEVIQDYGGGVCQVSSTIYSAVRQCSGIEIVERRPHSMRVSYLPEELEATVNWDNVDFKFRNNYDFPIELVVKANDDGRDGVLLVEVRKVER